MKKLLLVSKNRDFVTSVPNNITSVEIYRAHSGNEALALVSVKKISLVIVDESLGDMTGFEFLEKMVKTNPMINSAAVSSLSSRDFHDASEGLGIMMHLPPQPQWKHIEKLLVKESEIAIETSN